MSYFRDRLFWKSSLFILGFVCTPELVCLGLTKAQAAPLFEIQVNQTQNLTRLNKVWVIEGTAPQVDMSVYFSGLPTSDFGVGGDSPVTADPIPGQTAADSFNVRMFRKVNDFPFPVFNIIVNEKAIVEVFLHVAFNTTTQIWGITNSELIADFSNAQLRSMFPIHTLHFQKDGRFSLQIPIAIAHISDQTAFDRFCEYHKRGVEAQLRDLALQASALQISKTQVEAIRAKQRPRVVYSRDFPDAVRVKLEQLKSTVVTALNNGGIQAVTDSNFGTFYIVPEEIGQITVSGQNLYLVEFSKKQGAFFKGHKQFFFLMDEFGNPPNQTCSDALLGTASP